MDMENPGNVARTAGFEISTVDAEPFELCFDLFQGDVHLATLIWDGKPANAFTDDVTGSDDPVGWCLQFTDELRHGEPVLWCFDCEASRLDLAIAIACGMVGLRLLQRHPWQPLPDNRVWDEHNPEHVKSHQRIVPDPPRVRR